MTEKLPGRQEQCYKCYKSYTEGGLPFDPACELYYDLAHLNLFGRDELMCGQLEVILRDIEKAQQGDENLTYPHIVKKAQEDGYVQVQA